MPLTGIALDHTPKPSGTGWSLTDGSAGLRGEEIRTDNLAEIKMLLAQFGAGFAQAFAQSGIQSLVTANATSSPRKTTASSRPGPKARKTAANLYAQQIADTVKRDGIYIRVPAGTDFYLYVTQTFDSSQAKVGASLRMTDASPSKILP